MAKRPRRPPHRGTSTTAKHTDPKPGEHAEKQEWDRAVGDRVELVIDRSIDESSARLRDRRRQLVRALASMILEDLLQEQR